MFGILLRVTAAGLAISGADYARIVEEPRPTAPFIVPCPFTGEGQISFATYEEWRVIQGPSPLPWPNEVQPRRPVWLSYWNGTAFMGPENQVTIQIRPGTPIRSLRVMRFGEQPEMIEAAAWTFDPCDIDRDGRHTINDYMTFLASPYDWNGDRTTNILDTIDFWEACKP